MSGLLAFSTEDALSRLEDARNIVCETWQLHEDPRVRRAGDHLDQAIDDLVEEIDRLHDVEKYACEMWLCTCGVDCDCSVNLGWMVVTSPLYQQLLERKQVASTHKNGVTDS